MSAGAPASSLRALVAGLVDYAGLFPPAALPMDQAAAAYAGYLEAPERWMLGRFVVPVGRLDELSAAASEYFGARPQPWRLAMLASEDVQASATTLRAFNAAHAGRAVVDVVEVKASSADAITNAVSALGDGTTLYIEVAIAENPGPLLDVVRAHGARAKVRTGGLTPEAFPSSQSLARFIIACAQRSLPFKATAGLHHPLRAEHRLTYERDAAHGTMFGFLNVFAAAAMARHGAREADVVAILEERDAGAFRFDEEAMTWRDRRVSRADLERARAGFAIAFGSCSFREPVDDLQQLGLL